MNPLYQATAVAAFSDGSSREVTTEVQWSSSNPGVATVTPGGVVTPVAVGSSQIRATYHAITGGAALTVSEPASPPTPTPTPQQLRFRISGTVLDGLDQAPVAGVTITVAPSGGSTMTLRSNQNGAYAVELPSGSATLDVSVTAAVGGYASRTVQRTVSGDTAIDLSLDPLPFTLTGTVEDSSDGEAPWCVPIVVEIVSGPDAGRTIQLGKTANTYLPTPFEMPNVQPGTFTIRGSAPSYYNGEVSARFRGLAPFNSARIRLGRYPNSDSRPVCP